MPDLLPGPIEEAKAISAFFRERFDLHIMVILTVPDTDPAPSGMPHDQQPNQMFLQSFVRCAECE